MLAERDPSSYNMVEIEMILNYFPHMIWASEDMLRPLRDKFYYPLLQRIRVELPTVDNRQFVAVFQGMTLCGPKIFTKDFLNLFLN